MIQVVHCSTEEPLVDAFTKAAKIDRFVKLRSMIGVVTSKNELRENVVFQFKLVKTIRFVSNFLRVWISCIGSWTCMYRYMKV